MNYNLHDRILGSLVCAGMGDGMGAPTEAMSRLEIINHFGGYVDGFADPTDNPLVVGNVVAEVTDDASQMFEVAKAVIKCDGNITVQATADALVKWSVSYPKYYPRNAGPTTSKVIEELKQGGDPETLGLLGCGYYGRGFSNGVAMRIAAVGLAHPGDLNAAVNSAITSAIPTHGTQHAYSGAAAMACAIAEAMTENSTVDSVIKAALYGCEKGEEIGRKKTRPSYGPYCMPLLLRSLDIVEGVDDIEKAMILMEENIGCGGDIQPSLAVVLGIFKAAKGDWKKCLWMAANIGGDTDTFACMVGMIAGAFCGFDAIDPKMYAQFKTANPALDFESVANELTAVIEKK